jgi:hypothetical protein
MTATGTATPTDFSVVKCDFRDTSTTIGFITLVTGNATANSMDGLFFAQNNIVSLSTAGSTTSISILEAATRVKLLDNTGTYAILADTAALMSASDKNLTQVEIARNIIVRASTTTDGGIVISGTGTAWTGIAYDNLVWHVDVTGGTAIWIPATTNIGLARNFCPLTATADKSGVVNPAAV